MARAYVGTSGFSYEEWKPSFYPEDKEGGDALLLRVEAHAR
jgi:uncharacterized protein YecE (DUF72 family)